MRGMFDQECFGYLHHDHSFEPLPIPEMWKGTPYGDQIELSRRKRGYDSEPIYLRDAHYPSSAEIAAECVEFVNTILKRRT